ncbi:MAG: AAA family ATPase [Candidatus Woesearchaeota archaeon]
MAVILIGGVPGSGKTTIALELGRLLGIEQIVQTDTIKEMFQLQESPEYTYIATHKAWSLIGDKTKENIIKGYDLHARSFEKTLLGLIELTQKKGKNIIIEGVQINPELVSKILAPNVCFYLYVEQDSEHKKRFNLKNINRNKINTGWYENFDAIKAIDLYLRMGFKANACLINNIDISSTITEIINHLKEKSLGVGNVQRLRLCDGFKQELLHSQGVSSSGQ